MLKDGIKGAILSKKAETKAEKHRIKMDVITRKF